MNDIKFEGQVALVSGASRGIGAAIALELARRGLKVIGTATTEDGAAKINQTLSACLPVAVGVCSTSTMLPASRP
jgi:3-oxoacyl-[acyl-carrier protein] reductase